MLAVGSIDSVRRRDKQRVLWQSKGIAIHRVKKEWYSVIRRGLRFCHLLSSHSKVLSVLCSLSDRQHRLNCNCVHQMDSMMKVICLIVYLSAFSTTASSLSTVTVEDKRSNEVLIPLSQAPKTTMRILASPTAQPTTATIKNEGLAAYAMAASIPLLKNLACKNSPFQGSRKNMEDKSLVSVLI